MEAKFVVVGGKATKASLALTLPILVGRGHDADLNIATRTVSRRHAEIFESNGTVMIRDLGSLNGTIIDGQRVKEAPLPSGSRFSVGPLTFEVQYDAKKARNKTPSPKPAAKPDNPVASEPLTELPDFESVDDEPAEPVAKDKPKPSGDPFDDLLNDLD